MTKSKLRFGGLVIRDSLGHTRVVSTPAGIIEGKDGRICEAVGIPRGVAGSCEISSIWPRVGNSLSLTTQNNANDEEVQTIRRKRY